MNNRPKIEQFFILLLLSIGCFGVFALTGCGDGRSCEKPVCGKEEYKEDAGVMEAAGVSIPGCGGCLSPGEGCNDCLWAQSCKLVGGKYDYENEAPDGSVVSSKGNMGGCDTRFYGGGCVKCDVCLGYEQKEKAVYSGWISLDDAEDSYRGLFYGSTDDDEHLIGCYNGCFGCFSTGTQELELLLGLEALAGIDVSLEDKIIDYVWNAVTHDPNEGKQQTDDSDQTQGNESADAKEYAGEDSYEDAYGGSDEDESYEDGSDEDEWYEDESDEESEYILPYSDTERLTEDDVADLSLMGINYAKNEIYARHGRIFKSQELMDYFNETSWYKGTIQPENFDENVLLNDVERYNARFLSELEFSIDPNGYQLDQ